MSEVSRPRTRIAVLISGRGTNLQSLVRACRDGRIRGDVVLVVSNVAGAKGLAWAEGEGIATATVPHRDFPRREDFDRALLEPLRAAKADLVCLAGFMRVLTKVFLDAFPGRVLNIHPSLLPSFPGAQGQRDALEYGVRIAGATVHFVDAGTDTGPIVLQAAVPVRDDDTVDTLSARILEEEHRIYPEAVRLFCEGRLRIEGRRVHIAD